MTGKIFQSLSKFSAVIFSTVFSSVLTLVAVALHLPLVSTYFNDIGHDGQWYIAMAEGRIAEVVQPFSGRFLYPLLAGLVDKFSSLDLGHSFFLVSAISLFLFLFVVSWMLNKIVKSQILIFATLLIPYLLVVSKEFLLPDIFYIFLMAVFFFSLFMEMEMFSLFTLFLLFLARETTIVLGIILLLISFLRSKKAFFVATAIVILVSVFVTSQISQFGLSNPHNLGGLVYLVAKISYNFLNNIFGLHLWVNTLAENCQPIFKVGLPGASVFGTVREIGFCGFDSYMPSITVVALLATFGILPLVLFYILLHRRRIIFRDSPFWMMVALLSGLAYYFVGIPAGTGVERIIGYGWPAFLLAAPVLLYSFFDIDKKFIIKLLVAQILVSWSVFFLREVFGYSLVSFLVSLAFIIPAYAWTFSFLKRQRTLSVDPGL